MGSIQEEEKAFKSDGGKGTKRRALSWGPPILQLPQHDAAGYESFSTGDTNNAGYKGGGGIELMNSFQFFRRIKPSSPWCLLCARQCAKHPSVTGMIKAYLCFQEAHGLARRMEQEIDWRKEIKVPCGERSMANDASCCTLGLLHSLAWSRIFL